MFVRRRSERASEKRASKLWLRPAGRGSKAVGYADQGVMIGAEESCDLGITCLGVDGLLQLRLACASPVRSKYSIVMS